MTTGCFADWSAIGGIAGPCIRPGGAELTARAMEICGLVPGSHIADIGCGEGGTLQHLERWGDYRAVGLDCSDGLLHEAASRLRRGKLVRGGAERLPFKNDCLDAVFCECVLSILPEKTAALREFGRVLKEGGFLILSDVFDRGAAGHEETGGEAGSFPEDRFFTKEELLGVLARLGFSFLLWEEHRRSLTEFAARMILAGASLQNLWCGGRRPEGTRTDMARISYFLTVALKSRDSQ